MSKRGLLFIGSLIPLFLGVIAILYKSDLVRWHINRRRHEYFDKSGEKRFDDRRLEIQTASGGIAITSMGLLGVVNSLVGESPHDIQGWEKGVSIALIAIAFGSTIVSIVASWTVITKK